MKKLTEAKSRLALPDEFRQVLALGFALDVITAALDCPAVEHVVVVSDDLQVRRATAAWPIYRLPDPYPTGLSAVVDAGCRWAHQKWPMATTLVIPADLPAVTGRDLAQAVHSAAGHPAAFVRDAAGSGTTLLLRRGRLRRARPFRSKLCQRARTARLREFARCPDCHSSGCGHARRPASGSIARRRQQHASRALPLTGPAFDRIRRMVTATSSSSPRLAVGS